MSSFPSGPIGALIWVLIIVVIIVLIVYLIHSLLFIVPFYYSTHVVVNAIGLEPLKAGLPHL